MTFSPDTPPESLCLLRLSALGDITHTLPVLRTVQHHWPNTNITWVIGKTEYEIVRDIGDVNFIIFDKSHTLTSLIKLKRQLAQKSFDVVFHMQPSLRGNLVSACISSPMKLGFDHARSHDMHGVFIDKRIHSPTVRQHVLEGLLGFPIYFGLDPVISWNLPVSEAAIISLRQLVPEDKNYAVINPCAIAKKRNWRNWTIDGYIKISRHLVKQRGTTVVLTGGKSAMESDYAQAITEQCDGVINLVGNTTLAELVAVLNDARMVIAPDTGPVHIASALGTPTIGLFAATNPLRAAPYNHRDMVVSQYPQALLKWHGTGVEESRWGTRIRNSDAMSMIRAEQVIERIDQVLGNIKIKVNR